MEKFVNSCPAYDNKISDDCINYGCVCPTCLSRHRRLYPLNEHQSDLMVVLGIFKIKNIQKVCWECYAMVNNVTRFKRTAIQAQQLLLERDLVVLNAVGNFSRLRKTDSIQVLSVLEKDNEIQQTTDFKTMKPDLLAISLKLDEPIITTVKQNQSTAQVQIAPKPVTITERGPKLLDADHPVFKLDHYKNLTEQSYNSESTNNKSFVATVLENQSVTILGNIDVTAQSTSQSSFNYLNTSKADTSSIEDFTIKPQNITTVGISDALLETSETSLKDVKSSKTDDTLEYFFGVNIKEILDIVTLQTSDPSLYDVNVSKTGETLLKDSVAIKQSATEINKTDITKQEMLLNDLNVSKTPEALLEDSAAITQSVAKIERFTTQKTIFNDVNKAHDTPLEESVANTRSVSAIETSGIITQETMLSDINISKALETSLKDAAMTQIVRNVKKPDNITQETVLNDINTSKPRATPLEDPAVITNDVTALGTSEVITLKSSKSSIHNKKESKTLETSLESSLVCNQSITKPVTSDSKVINVKNSKPAETWLTDLFSSVDKLTLHNDDETPCEISTEQNTGVMDNQVKDSVEAPVNSDDFTAKVLNVIEYVSDDPSKTNSNVGESDNNPDILLCTEDLNDSPEEIDESNITHLGQKQPNQKRPTVIQKLKKVSNILTFHQKNVKSGYIINLKCLENNINTIVKQQIQKENERKRRKSKFDGTTEIEITDNTFANTPNKSDSNNQNKQNLNLHERNIKKQQQLVVNRITDDSSWKLMSDDIQAKLTEHDKNNQPIYSKKRDRTTKEITNRFDTATAFKNAVFDHNYSKNSLYLYEIACSKLYYMNYYTLRNKGKKKINEHNNMMEVIQKTFNSIDKQNETTMDVLSNEQLEISIIDDWDKELLNASIDDKQKTKNEQIKSKNNQVHKDVSSTDMSAVQPSAGTITHKRVDLETKENTQNKTYKDITLITDIKVEKCYPEHVEQSHELNHDYSRTEDRCKIEQEEIDIKPEPFSCDSDGSLRNSTSETDTSSETEYLENAHCESALNNYYNVDPAETDPSKRSYYDYQYKPLDHSEDSPVDNDKSGLKNESNITNNPNEVPTDFEMNNITVWFSSFQFNTDTTTESAIENADNPNSILANNSDVLNTTEDLLKPHYYTSWTDETYENHSKVIKDSSKNTRKRVSDQEKAVVKSIKVEKDKTEVKGQRLSERIRNKKLDLTRNKNNCVECACNQNKLRNKPNRLNKDPHVTNNDKTLLQKTNYDKLLLHPTVLLNKIETDQFDNNITLMMKIKDEPPKEHEEVIATPDKINVKIEPVKNEICNESTTDLVQDAITTTAFDQLTNINNTKRPRTRKVNRKVPINSNKRTRRNKQETTMYTIRALRDGEFETLKAKIINGSKFQAAKFKCFKCVRKFREKGYLDYHLKSHQASAGSVACEKCERRFKDEKKMKVHAAIHERCFQCLWCPKEYLIVEDYKKHVEIGHPAENSARNKRLYTCEICHQVLRNQGRLRYHKKKVHFAVETNVTENFTDNNSSCAQNNSSLVGNNSRLTGNISSLSESFTSLTGNNSSLTGNNSSLTENNLSVTRSNSSFRDNIKNTCAVCDMKFRTTFACKRHFKAAHASKGPNRNLLK